MFDEQSEITAVTETEQRVLWTFVFVPSTSLFLTICMHIYKGVRSVPWLWRKIAEFFSAYKIVRNRSISPIRFDLWIDRGLKPISGLGIGVGPPRDPKSRDTLGRILGIFASVSHQIFYSSNERGEATGSKIMFSLSSVILFWHY